tara:strand:+ start:1384 stop:1761 length:378 start_codon:yes stop_codon:yes gene_type:complete
MYDLTSKLANNSPLPCWKGYKRKPGTTEFSEGSCVRDKSSPATKKQKGGGTRKTCLPAAKIRSMSKSERQRLINAKQKSGKAGKYRRSSKTNVKGARKKGATLRDWFRKEDWRQVNNPKKKCGEK